MFITVTAATALVSVAINAAALGVAGYASYRYLHGKCGKLKEWMELQEGAESINTPPDGDGRTKSRERAG